MKRVILILGALATWCASGEVHDVRAENGLADSGAIWVAHPVLFPVNHRDVSPDEPKDPVARIVRGPIEVAPDRAALLWLDSLRAVRVRVEDPSKDMGLAFARVIGGSEPGTVQALVEEPGVLVEPGMYYLVQPAPVGSVWMITAKNRTRVRIEHVETTRGHVAWESMQRMILDWIDSDEDELDLPPFAGVTEFLNQLRAEREFAHAIGAANPAKSHLTYAAKAWRKASAIRRLTLLRPLFSFYFRITRLEDQLTDIGPPIVIGNNRPYRRVAEYERSWRIELDGPGVLRVDARALLSEGQTHDSANPIHLRVLVGDQPLGSIDATPVPVLWARQEEDTPPDDAEASAEAEEEPLIPVRQEYLLPGGEYLGNLQRLTVPLRPGRHMYTLEVMGGPIALRITRGIRRPFSRETLTNTEHEGDHARRARHALKDDPSVSALLLGHLLADIDGLPENTNSLLEALECDALSPLVCALAQHQIVRSNLPEPVRKRALTRAYAALAQVQWETSWYLRVLIADHLSYAGQYQALRNTLRAAERTPPKGLMPRIAEILPPPLSDERSRSRPIALMDLGWRAAPLDSDIRTRYREMWREKSTWSRLSPADEDDWRIQDDARAWLRPDDTALGRPGSWGLLPAGKTVWVQAPRADIDPSRPAILRLAVSTCNDDPGPITIHIDNNTWQAVPLHTTERWAFAVSPGEHAIVVEAPGCARIYCALPESEGREGGYIGAAWVEKAWPLQADKSPKRYDLPAPHVQGPVQVRLRALLPDGEPRVGTVFMKTDMGMSRRIDLTWNQVDEQVALMEGKGRLSDSISFVVSPPVGARHIWFEAGEEVPVFASVFVRRPTEEVVQTPVSKSPRVKPISPLEELSELSAILDENDPDTRQLIRRAHLFLDLGFPDLAQRDAKRATSGVRDAREASIQRAYRALLIRLERQREPAHLPATSPAGAALRPVPLYPSDLALPEQPTQNQLEVVRNFRRQPDLQATSVLEIIKDEKSLRTRYLGARILEWNGDYLRAGRQLTRLAQDAEAWQVLRDASLSLGLALEEALHIERDKVDTSTLGLAALTYGVARDLDDRGPLPDVRKVLFLASELSRWSPVRAATHSAGYQRLMVEQEEEQNPRALVNKAMIAPPWRTESSSQIVRPGHSAALQIKFQEQTKLYADLWCRQFKLPRPGQIPVCRISILVDGRPLMFSAGKSSYDTALTTGRMMRVPIGTLEPGLHRIEVGLSSESRIHRAAIRFLSDREMADSAQVVESENGRLYPFRVRTPVTSFIAGSGSNRRVEMLVNGPSSIYVSSRSNNDNRASRLDIEVIGTISKNQYHRSMALRTEHDPEASLREGQIRFRELTVTTATVIPIPDPGPHRIRIIPDNGQVYVQVALREDRDETEPSEVVSQNFDDRPENELLRWPGIAAEIALLEASYPYRPSSEGIFSVDTSMLTNDLDESDSLPQVTKIDVAVSWRRQLLEDRIWVYAGLLARRHFDGRYIAGGRARILDVRLPGGMRGFGELRVFTQMIESGLEWSAYGRFDIDRPVRLTSDLTLIPELSLRTGAMSLDFDNVSLPGPEIDPDIYSIYRFFHLHTAIPQLALRWRPFQDHIGSVSTSAVPNTDFVSLDRVQLALRWTTLLHIAHRRTVLTQLSYRPSYRFYDEDRFDAYGRHDLRASVETNLWTGRTGRLRAHAQGTLYWSNLYGQRTTFVVGLAYDLTRGRGLRDFFSFEEEFDPYVEGRMWVYNE